MTVSSGGLNATEAGLALWLCIVIPNSSGIIKGCYRALDDPHTQLGCDMSLRT